MTGSINFKPILIAAFAVFFLFPGILKAVPMDEVREIVFDFGDSGQSVAVMQDRIVAAGDYYENYEITDFEPTAVIARELQSQDMVRWGKSGSPDAQLLTDARNLFVAKQMKAIFEAQNRHLNELGYYALDLETLIQRGFLEDGFDEEGKKLGYTYEMSEAGDRRAFAYLEKEPFFMAQAYPDNLEELYFSVDQLGHVRYGTTNSESRWGPVWEYHDTGHVMSQNLGLNPEYGGSS